jgi:hypothetical protein
MPTRKRAGIASAAALATIVCVAASQPALAASTPSAKAASSFYAYNGSIPLKTIAPGTVLKTRTVRYHFANMPLGLTATQLLYRSTGPQGQPTVNVTSIVRPMGKANTGRAVAYGSLYDSLNPKDSPSYGISGKVASAGQSSDEELALFSTFLLQGYNVIIPDTEGENADFASGPEYGMNTLDAIRAASSSPTTGLSNKTKVGLLGYSGGAIATGWAAALAPTYAPDVNRRLVGTAEGGVLVDPSHNLHYISGSKRWAGVMVMALLGIARAYNIDMTPYLNDYGQRLFNQLSIAPIGTVLGAFPGLTWVQIAKPAYPEPESIPAYVTAANKVNMGSSGVPTAPMFIGQGANGLSQGTPGNKPGIGAGDGIMITGDVRALARKYCSSGTPVEYVRYPLLSHTTAPAAFFPAAIAWLGQRFAGSPAPENCSSIEPGNSLAPIPVQ